MKSWSLKNHLQTCVIYCDFVFLLYLPVAVIVVQNLFIASERAHARACICVPRGTSLCIANATENCCNSLLDEQSRAFREIFFAFFRYFVDNVFTSEEEEGEKGYVSIIISMDTFFFMKYAFVSFV